MALTGKVDAVMLVNTAGDPDSADSPGAGPSPTAQPRASARPRGTGAEIDEAYSVYTVGEYYAQPAALEAPPGTAETSRRSPRRAARRARRADGHPAAVGEGILIVAGN